VSDEGEVVTVAGSRETPAPQEFEWDRGYWDAAREGRLVVQACRSCGTVRSLPRPMCPSCASFEYEWRESRGLGRIYSFTVLRKQFHRLFPDVPLVTCIVELDDYPTVHLVSNLRGVAAAELAAIEIGRRVSVEFVTSGPVVLPQFRLIAD
jgi:uncharacterized OB-fold protein